MLDYQNESQIKLKIIQIKIDLAKTHNTRELVNLELNKFNYLNCTFHSTEFEFD